MKTAVLLVSMLIVSQAYSQTQCAAYCLDVRAEKNQMTQQTEKRFNRSPYLKAKSYQDLVSKCKANFGTALLSGFKYKRTYDSSSMLTDYRIAKAQNACKSI